LIKLPFLILLLINLFLAPSFAATEFVSNINGGAVEDYNSLSAWEAAMDNMGNLTDGTVATGNWDAQSGVIADNANVTWNAGADDGKLIHMTDAGATGTYLVMGDDAGDITNLADDDIISDGTNTITVNGTPDSAIVVAECYDDDGALDEGSFGINIATTSATNYVIIRAAVGERHDGTLPDGTAGDGFVWIRDGNDYFVLQNNFTVWEWIAINLSSSEGGNNLGCGADSLIIRNNIIMETTDNGADYGMRFGAQASSPLNFCLNNIVIGAFDVACISWLAQIEVYNCTTYGGAIGFKREGWLTVVKNCVAVGNGTDFSITHGETTEDYNCSEDATAAGANSITTGSDTDFVNAGTDMHLAAGAVQIDDGLDLVTTPSGVEIDIDGRDRDAEGDTWDMGADEYVAAVPTGAPQVILISG